MTVQQLPRGTRLASTVALVALAATLLVPFANPAWAAWRFDHEHLTLDAALHSHAHPWEAAEGFARDPGGAGDGDRASEVAASGAQESSGAGFAWAPVATALVIAAVAVMVVVAVPRAPLASLAHGPLPPPPRG